MKEKYHIVKDVGNVRIGALEEPREGQDLESLEDLEGGR